MWPIWVDQIGVYIAGSYLMLSFFEGLSGMYTR